MASNDHLSAWVENTTAFDRVQSIIITVSEPVSAAYVSNEARVAENTARSHLQRLVELGILQRGTEDGTHVYYPDPLYTRMKAIRRLLNSYEDRSALIDHQAKLQGQCDEYQDRYEVESPSELRTMAAAADSAEQIRELKKTASVWETAEYRLSLLKETIRNYDIYTQSPLS